MKTYIHALTIAGFDGSGGAGIQADLKTFSALGCYGMTVLTALPIQNTTGVRNVYDISAPCVAEQLTAIFEDIDVDVVKIGMLHRPEIITTVASVLQQYQHLKIVTDPVMVAKSGDRLLTSDSLMALKEKILPLTTVLTPNLPEACDLLQRPIETDAEMEQAAKDLAALGPTAVVVKGGHRQHLAASSDCLYIKPLNEIIWFESPRIATNNTHGTGCTFSAAIAAYLGRGNDILSAVRLAKDYLTSALAAGAHYQIGHGCGPVHHFYGFWG